MRLRAPAYPLITIDPYFSVWSPADRLTDTDTVHWTGSKNSILAEVTIDGKPYRLIGGKYEGAAPAAHQVSVDMNALTTTYVFEQDGVRLTLLFTSPLLPDDLYMLTRPVSYLEVRRETYDHHKHDVKLRLSVSEELCVNIPGELEVEATVLEGTAYPTARMGAKDQRPLNRSGDSLRIDWGYLYLSAKTGALSVEQKGGMTYLTAKDELNKKSTLFTFAYDDVYSIQYFGKNLRSYWNREGASILDEISAAIGDYSSTVAICQAFSDVLFLDAVRAGGEKYAELCELSFRQTVAAHKLVLDEDGCVLWISKECYSNGCGATVDVSYPSIPLFLIFNPELVCGMMRPIYKFAASEAWKYDFAPHDCGQYPLLNGQVYGLKNGELLFEKQMPVEECGNMLVMEAAVALATGDTSFANSHMDTLKDWVKYLIDNGADPANQLCIDDFAGHLAHNCNLSLKAIMGIAGLAIILRMDGKRAEANKYMRLARSMALDWARRAQNEDGSYRLAFDKEGSFSMKYNIVWDKLFGTELMPKYVIENEIRSYKKHLNAYGLPLDSRKTYTKSDWTAWTATLASEREDFDMLIDPMWQAFNSTPSRVPMTDWYYTDTSLHKTYFAREEQVEKSFRNRTVQGGIFIKLLEYYGDMKVDF